MFSLMIIVTYLFSFDLTCNWTAPRGQLWRHGAVVVASNGGQMSEVMYVFNAQFGCLIEWYEYFSFYSLLRNISKILLVYT